MADITKDTVTVPRWAAKVFYDRFQYASEEKLDQELLGAVMEFAKVFTPLRVPLATEPAKDCRLVTVCDKCLQASCWQGFFMCDDSAHAGTVDLPVHELIRLNREHPCYWRFDLEDTCPMCGGPPDHCTSDCERRRGKDGDL